MFWHRASESLVDPFDKNKCAHFNEIFSEHIECNVDIAYLKKKNRMSMFREGTKFESYGKPRYLIKK